MYIYIASTYHDSYTIISRIIIQFQKASIHLKLYKVSHTNTNMITMTVRLFLSNK